jgi:uncharacterized protein YegP (UPF0339 family)
MEYQMPAKFTVYKDRVKQYRFNLKAVNGESYPDKKSTLKGIASIQKNAAAAKIVDDTGESETAEKPGRKPAGEASPPKPRGRKPESV